MASYDLRAVDTSGVSHVVRTDTYDAMSYWAGPVTRYDHRVLCSGAEVSWMRVTPEGVATCLMCAATAYDE